MLVTRETDYAVRTVLYLAKNTDRRVSVTEIAEAMHIPKSFLAKLLQRLVKNHVLESSRGVKGGFELARKASSITLLDVMEVMQGPAAINVCAIDSSRCKMSATCSVHPVWVEIRRDVEKKLAKTTIARLIERQ